MKIFIIPTSSAQYLAGKIKKKRDNFRIIFPTENKDGKRCFPDGEIYIKIPKAERLKDRRVIVLHSGIPKPNEGLIELELILQILRDSETKTEVFFTYFPYSQQDKVFEKGETNIAENLIEKLINYYNVKKIYIIDAHFEGNKWVKKYPIINISAVPLLIEKVKEEFAAEASFAPRGRGKDILFVSPDIGGKRRTGIRGVEKKRLDTWTVEIKDSKGLENIVKGRVIGVVDDILETGGTLDRFYDECKKFGAKKVIALITHGILSSGIQRIKKKYWKLYLTNTVRQKRADVDVTDLILNTISKN